MSRCPAYHVHLCGHAVGIAIEYRTGDVTAPDEYEAKSWHEPPLHLAVPRINTPQSVNGDD
eukprot:5015556-Amphidinium_carterae.1